MSATPQEPFNHGRFRHVVFSILLKHKTYNLLNINDIFQESECKNFCMNCAQVKAGIATQSYVVLNIGFNYGFEVSIWGKFRLYA